MTDYFSTSERKSEEVRSIHIIITEEMLVMSNIKDNHK